MSSKKQATAAHIRAEQTNPRHISSLFENGNVHAVTYHSGRTIEVCRLISTNHVGAIVKDARGKRRQVSFKSIKTMKVDDHVLMKLTG